MQYLRQCTIIEFSRSTGDCKMGGRVLKFLLLLAVLTTFVSNVLFMLRPCNEEKSVVFPWKRINAGKFDLGEQEVRHDHDLDALQEREVFSDHESVTSSSTEEPAAIFRIDVYSSQSNISVKINDKKIFHEIHVNYIGINAIIINEATGVRMGSKAFDTYNLKEESQLLQEYIQDVTVGRIVCLAAKDEASHSLKKSTRAYLKRLGSEFINRLNWRDMWAFVIQKTNNGARVLGESYQSCFTKTKERCDYGYGEGWAAPVELLISFKAQKNGHYCDWENTPSNIRRMEFCSQYEGYPGVCNCENPRDVEVAPPAFKDGSRLHIPIAIMVGNRPAYFFRMITSLQKAIGLDVSMVTVFIDGFHEEPAAVARLFDLKLVQHEPKSRLSGRIAQHYKRSLSESFDNNPDAQHLLILEEDLAVSIDILSYFKQLLPVLENDDSLFCVSAWNDQGYEHAVHDPAMLYRIETMPGLGWILKRKIYKGEIEHKWPGPEAIFDWDMWMRGEGIMKGRECIIPDISRTYHFGSKGMNVGSFMQAVYFKKHALNTVPDVKLDASIMYNDNYEKEVKRLISTAEILDHHKTPCKHLKTFVPDTTDKTYVFYIVMEHKRDYQTWNNVARCFRIWDLDARGFHKSMFRLFYKKNHIIVVGCPSSVYCSLKPDNIEPINMPNKERRPADDP